MELVDIRKSLVKNYISQFPREAAEILNNSEVEEIFAYLHDCPAETASQLFLGLTPNVTAQVLTHIDDELYVNLFEKLDPYVCSIVLSRIERDLADAKLHLLPSGKSKTISELLSYPRNTAGSLMDTRVVTFHPNDTIGNALEKLRAIGDKGMTLLYVTDTDGKLLGKISVHMIAISPPEQTLGNLAETSIHVNSMTPEDEVVTLFQENRAINIPVVDLEQRFLGIIRNESLIKAAQKEASDDVLTMFGAGKEEMALSPAMYAVKKRLPWLEINLATAFLAASIVGIFEDTIAQITVLAVFLPVVAGQSGNTGSQALAVTMRGLALREIRTNHWWKVARKEIVVGFVNGLAVALTTSLIVFFWASSFGLAVVIGVSMIVSMVIAGFSGAVVPIALKKFGQDPAQSSSIVLTTVTDIIGFLSFLGLATLLGSALGII